jgi:hypothetical protein
MRCRISSYLPFVAANLYNGSTLDGVSPRILDTGPQSSRKSESMQPNTNKGVYQALLNESAKAAEAEVKAVFGSLIQESQYVGDVYSLGYESVLILIYDFHRQKVGGIPGLSFLIAIRITPQQVLADSTIRLKCKQGLRRQPALPSTVINQQ